MKDYTFDAFIRARYTASLAYCQEHPYDLSYYEQFAPNELDRLTVPGDDFLSPEEDLACVFHQNHPYGLMPHRHDYFELIYAYRGSLSHTIENRQYLLTEGDICLLNPNSMHCLDTVDKDTVFINLLIRPRFLDWAFQRLSVSDNIVLNFFYDCFYKSAKSAELLFPHQEIRESSAYTYLHMAIREIMEKKEEYRNAAGYALLLFCLELTRVWKNRAIACDSNAKTSIDDIIEYLYENIRTATLESTAKHFHYHRTYLPQYLKRHTGMTFSEILQNIRFAIARQKLSTTDLTAEEIAGQIGYANVASFYRMFKKEAGLSPSQYKEKYH